MSKSVSIKIISPTRADSALLGTDFFLTIGSRRVLKTFFAEGRIRLNGNALKASSTLPVGEHILQILDSETSEMDTSGPLRILYEDSCLIAVQKPRGVHSAPIPRQKNDTVVNRIQTQFGEPYLSLPEGGLLHRLDRWTSGILLFAKTLDVWNELKKHWSDRVLEKRYRARVSLPESKRPLFLNTLPIEIELALGHDIKDRKLMRVIRNEHDLRSIRGAPIRAHTTVIGIEPIDPERAWAIVQIETGVQHQIRAHLAHVGLPLDGDALYHPSPGPHAQKFGFVLHHERLTLVHPHSQQNISIEDRTHA